ncbi:TPA: hypothetical protein EYP83_01470 [Candidatus Geothermarchaeota archaeon]|nr:hypothetical protein [Candidatus Geothermarchaeota archaeon]
MGKFTRVIAISLFNVLLVTTSYLTAGIVSLVFTATFSGFILGIASSDVLEGLVGYIITVLLTILSIIALLLTSNPASTIVTQHLTTILLIFPLILLGAHSLVYIIFRRIVYR